MKRRTATAVLILLIIATASLHAAVIPGRWEKVEALEEGYPIIVTMKGWERIKGSFRGVNDESLLLIKDDGKELDLPKADVIKVESQDKPNNDSLLNGPMWGAIVGGGLSALGMAVSHDDLPSDEVVGVIALSTGIGAGIGFVGDALIKTADVFYEAPKK
jgi:hypothetical protein